MSMKITNGSLLSAPAVIAFSSDDTGFDEFILKATINNIAFSDTGGQFVIVIQHNISNIKLIDLSKVTNQSWQNNSAGLVIAIADILSWI